MWYARSTLFMLRAPRLRAAVRWDPSSERSRVLLGLCRGRTLLNRNRSNRSISNRPEVGAESLALLRSTHVASEWSVIRRESKPNAESLPTSRLPITNCGKPASDHFRVADNLGPVSHSSSNQAANCGTSTDWRVYQPSGLFPLSKVGRATYLHSVPGKRVLSSHRSCRTDLPASRIRVGALRMD